MHWEHTASRQNEQLFPKRWSLSNPIELHVYVQTSDKTSHKLWHQKTIIREPRQNFPLGTVSNELPVCLNRYYGPNESNEKAMNRNQSNQKANPTLKTKTGNNQNHKQTRYSENKWLTEWAAISQKVATKQPKPN